MNCSVADGHWAIEIVLADWAGLILLVQNEFPSIAIAVATLLLA